MVWTSQAPLLATVAADVAADAGGSASTELDREQVESVATDTLKFAEQLEGSTEFKDSVAHVSSVGLGGLDESTTLAQLHTAAHVIVFDTLKGLRADIEGFAVGLNQAVAAVDESDQLSATVLNQIAAIDATDHADRARAESQQAHAPIGGAEA